MKSLQEAREGLFDGPIAYTAESTRSLIPVTTKRYLGVNEAMVPEIELPEPKRWKVPVISEAEKEDYLLDLSEAALDDWLRIESDESVDVPQNASSYTRYALEVTVPAGAHGRLFVVQRLPLNLRSRVHLELELQDDSRLEVYLVDLGARDHQLTMEADLGARARFDLGGIYFAAKDQRYDYNYELRYHGCAAEANLNLRGALKDQARKIMRYTLDFRRGSKGSKGAESEGVTLLSDGVYNSTVPYLLCDEDDVEGLHAASIGRLDEDARFYLMTRGFSWKEAERILVMAQFSSILDHWPDDGLRETLITEIESRINMAENANAN